MQTSKPQRPAPPSREEALAVFTFVRQKLGVKQREIGKETGLDQGSVSKLCKGNFRNVKGRAYRLWKYAKRRADKAGYQAGQPAEAKGDSRLAEKINRVWDQTEEGAQALLKLLDAADLIQKRGGSGVRRRK